MIRVAVIEDHAVFRDAMSATVRGMTQCELVGATQSIEDWDLRDWTSDVVLLDMNLPGLCGSAGVRHVVGRGVAVLVVSAALPSDELCAAIAAGASGFVAKSADPAVVSKAIRIVAAREIFMSPILAAVLLDETARAGLQNQSGADGDVLGLIASGETYRDIAEDLAMTIIEIHACVRRYVESLRLRR